MIKFSTNSAFSSAVELKIYITEKGKVASTVSGVSGCGRGFSGVKALSSVT